MINYNIIRFINRFVCLLHISTISGDHYAFYKEIAVAQGFPRVIWLDGVVMKNYWYI